MILDDMSYWGAFKTADNSAIAAVITGTGPESQDSQYISTEGWEFNFEYSDLYPIGMNGRAELGGHMNGFIGYDGTGGGHQFFVDANASYANGPSIDSMAGVYQGTLSGFSGNEPVTIAISSGGVLDGQTASGCEISGTLVARQRGNAADLAIALQGNSCPASPSLAGVFIYDELAQNGLAIVTDSSRTAAIVIDALKTH